MPLGTKSEKVQREKQWDQLSFGPLPIGNPREYKHILTPALGNASRRQLSAESHTGRRGYDYVPPLVHAVPTSPRSSVQTLNTSSSLPLCWFCSSLLSQPTVSPRIISSFSLQEWNGSVRAPNKHSDRSGEVVPPNPTIPFSKPLILYLQFYLEK